MTLGRGGQNGLSVGIYISLKFLFLFIRVLIGVNILCTIILYGPTQYMRREARLVVHWRGPMVSDFGSRWSEWNALSNSHYTYVPLSY